MGRTDEQIAAINSTGNVIVSAGAGSGKTSVLTERVYTNIIKGVKLDELLILTFTEAAASEMKERIKDVLLKNDETFDLVPFVDSANICTFDAYFLFLVKKYADKFGFEKEITIIPDDIVMIKKHEIVDEIFNRYAEEGNKIFEDLVINYCRKNVKQLVEFVLNVDEAISKREDKFDFIENYPKKYLGKENYDKFINEILNPSFKKYLDEINDAFHDYDYEYGEKVLNIKAYKEIFDNPNFDFLKNVDVKGVKLPSKVKGKNDAYLNNIKKAFKDKFLSIFKNVNTNDIEKDVELNDRFIPFILDVVKELEVKIDKYKKEKLSFTFQDIAYLAKKLLSENEDIRLSIKNKLKLIMIDEYQDTSIAQEEFINMIGNNNVFVVGDVKQSIYGFRDANPQQFVLKYEKYKKGDGGIAIDMNTNFRSRKEVTDEINHIFSNIMTLENGGADYAKDHIILAGNKDYDKKDTGNVHGLTQYEYVVDEVYPKDRQYREEILSVIKDIKSRIANKMQVYDRDLGDLRDCNYSDFALLLAKGKKFKDIERIFIENGVPINAIYEEDIISDDSIAVLISILRFVNEYNGERQFNKLKHYLVSIMRSFLFRYSDNEIYKFCKEEDFKNHKLYSRFADFSFKNRGSMISELYLNIMKEFNFIENLAYLGNAYDKLKFSKLFYERTKIMDDLGFNLDAFILYLERLNDLSLKMEVKKNASGFNAVTLMTIHKSKGLEFPVVYLPKLDDSKNPSLKRTKFYSNLTFGFYLPSLYNKDNKSLHYLFDCIFNRSDVTSEKIRLLYVALTRAKEEVVVPSFRVRAEDEEPLEIDELHDEFWEEDEYCEEEEEEEIDEDYDEEAQINVNGLTTLDVILKAGKPQYNLDTFYDMECEEEKSALMLKSKKIVEFRRLNYEFDEKKVFRASKDLTEDANDFILHEGTHLHLLMEIVDFKTKDVSVFKSEEDRKMISKVLSNHIFDNLENAKIYKEYEYHDESLNYTGIIDLMIEKEDHIDIIDYKLKNIDDEKYLNQLTLYKNYIASKFNKPINCYLLSLKDNLLKKVM